MRFINSIHLALLVIGLGYPHLGLTCQAANPHDTTQLQTALDTLDQWIGEGENGNRWRKFLRSAELRQQIDKGQKADPAIVGEVLKQYRTDTHGLDKSHFVAVRKALQAWHETFWQLDQTLIQSVRDAQNDHVPVTDAQLAVMRNKLRLSAQALEHAIGGQSTFALDWKKYLLWDLLAPHFETQFKVTGNSLRNLDKVLKRFRKNHPGLENPKFTRTARAIEHYRELAFWYALAQRVDTRPRYSSFLKELDKQLTRTLEIPTVESTRQVGKILGLVDDLGHSPLLVEQIRKRFSQPNLSIRVSENAINALGERPVTDTQPVRDCILEATVRGTATTCGQLTLHTVPAADHIELEVQLVGHIQSRTTSYKKPVVVSSLGHTNFVSSTRLQISDEEFVTHPSTTHAQTKTDIRSIRKTGGDFGRRLIERIARKKVSESKAEAQYIASRKAEKKVSRKFDRELAEGITMARYQYEGKWRPPLVRMGMFPEYLRTASHAAGVHVEARLASYKQISTAVPPPQKTPQASTRQDDFLVQVHESAANNIFPVVLAGASLQQDQADQAPRLEGDVPDWLKNFSLLESDPSAEQQPADAQATPVDKNFRPWAFQLHNDHPASLHFDDQKITIRIRIAELKTLEDGEEKIRENWDFLITYRILSDGDGLLFRRDGKIQALPTGFDPQWFGDPRWNDKLTGEQVGVRRNLENNLNRRAAAGEGFPEEIRVPAIQLPGREQPLKLQQLDCDDGWLTLGYGLP